MTMSLCLYFYTFYLFYIEHFQIAYTMQLKIEGKTYHAESNTKKAAKQGLVAGLQKFIFYKCKMF